MPLGRACPSCGSRVSPSAKFCSECAHPIGLAQSSRVAPRPIAPESYIPKHLAERIRTSRTALEGERKHVTVLFADIAGSMELLADRDPEEAHKLLDPALDQMIEAVHHYEGTVHKIMGDGIMALFGAPLAHEDHAVRACYASLRMQETVSRYADEVQRSHGLPVTIRVGLNSGEIVVCAIGNDLRMDYIVVGQTVHLAARMEQMAKPGSVLATANTLRLAEGYVTAKSLGPVPVKGLANRIEVYEVSGDGPARTKLQAATQYGLTRFVGREGEMIQLRQLLDRAGTGYGQVVAVVGEAGVGKSRLIHELVRSHHAADWLILKSNSVSYGRATPYLPLIELLKDYFKVNVRDSTRSIREKVTGRILALDPSLQDAIPPVLDLLDALYDEHPFRSVDPLQHRQYTYQSVTRLLRSENRVQPILMVLEDLHWSDSLTLGLLSEIITIAQDARLLLVTSYRPEYQDEWIGRPNYHQLRLDPLASGSLENLLQALLGPDPSLSALKGLLAEHAGGNPFFVEEIVRALVDNGVLERVRGSYQLTAPLSSIEVPPTVQAVLGARIDTLPAPEKRLLQEAAVIGHDAPFALLHAICGLAEYDLRGLLENLQTAEFLYASQLFPELQYTFKHSLTHDVAYAGLLHERRRDIHARIVDAIEKLYADRIGEQLERLADHALRGHLWEKAISYLRQAGMKAADRQAYREAVDLFEKALGALAQLPESRDTLEQAIDIRFDIRNVLQPLGDRDRIADYLREAECVADRLGDGWRMGWVQSYLTDHFWMLGRFKDAVAASERALAIAEELVDLPLRIVTNLPLGLAYHTRGDYRKAMEYFHCNVKLLESEHERERFGMFVLPSSFSRSFIGWCFAELGDFAEGFSAGEEALRIAEAAEHPFSCGYAHLGLGVISLRQGDPRRALRSFERALAAGAFADSPVGFTYVAFHLGYALALVGRPDEGIPLLEQTAKVAESRGFIARHALRLAYLCEAYLIAGRCDDATKTGLRALALAREHDERANEAYALRALGEVDVRCDRPTEAEARFRAALRLSKRLGMRPLEAHCHRGIANALQGSDQSAAAAHGNSARALVDAMHMRFWGDRLPSASQFASLS
jgi:class 3 adenylate cyclase/tetratricopeptide (TPR) repeat protein